MPVSVGVSVAILQAEAVLLILRGDFAVWGLPGGGVEDGETTAEAAVREVREETSIRIDLERMVGIYYYLRGHQVLFVARWRDGEPRPDGIETLDARWFPLSSLPEQMIGWHRFYLQEAMANRQGVVCRLTSDSTVSRLTRSELYQLKAEGNLDLPALLAEICAPVPEEDIVYYLKQ